MISFYFLHIKLIKKTFSIYTYNIVWNITILTLHDNIILFCIDFSKKRFFYYFLRLSINCALGACWFIKLIRMCWFCLFDQIILIFLRYQIIRVILLYLWFFTCASFFPWFLYIIKKLFLQQFPAFVVSIHLS